MIEVNNHRLIPIARHFRNLTQNELALKLGNIKQSSLSKIEKGYIKFSNVHCELIANELKLPTKFFTQEKLAINPSSLDYKFLDLPSNIELKITADLSIIIKGTDLLLSVLMLQHKTGKIFIEKQIIPKDAAILIRKNLDLPSGPIHPLNKYIEDSNIVVHYYDADEKFEGISTFTDSGIPMVIINERLSILKKRVILIQEIGHLVLHVNKKNVSNNPTKEAEEFAFEFLMPENECQTELSLLNLKKIESLSVKWGVPKLFVLKRALSLNRINERTYNYLKIELIRRKAKDNSEQDMEDFSNLDSRLYLIKKETNETNIDLAAKASLFFDDFKILFLR